MYHLNSNMFEDIGQQSYVLILAPCWWSESCVPVLPSDWSTHPNCAVIGPMWRNSSGTATGGILNLFAVYWGSSQDFYMVG